MKKILIANRGEIALRINRACKELGISTVAVFSEADRDSLHVRFADEAVCIGPPESRESYLNIPRIIAVAEVTNADGIHPGYGFLAENAQFAEICESSGFFFIGPPAKVIRKMGDKVYARELMKRVGIPVLEGSEGALEDLESGREICEEIGYPVMLKAAAGGGGKGMRIARNLKEFEIGYRLAQAEAQAAFGDGRLYVEKYIENPRHIEFQILADSNGNVLHLFERECSIQRRHQKLVEESPSCVLSPDLREEMGEMAVRGAKEAGYVGAGTIEFLLDSERKFYFMEMNARIQVEHPVTEWVTGVDLIKAQIMIASGEKLPFKQNQLDLKGHAMEFRINAEDPHRDFTPSPGKVTSLHIPGGLGLRVDTHLYTGYIIPPFYDSLIAKVIAHGKDRMETLNRLERAVEEFICEGVKTTIPFFKRLLQDESFRRGEIHTGFIDGWKGE
ncbi:acetyl-CoA carboxylase biotin carboxylase subunit [candidate division TA06 bacterium]|nr:acetyl-CoA carboxylase biotin carboxylase subunit [candidate division TA06 bacterium]